MWIDPANGLLVRREIYDQTGRLVRASAFVDLEVGSVSMPAVAASPAPTASGTVLTSASLTQLRAQGWVTPDLLPDEMVLYDARTTDTAGHHILHLSYSNGLSTLSLFVERGRLDANHLTGWQRMSMGGSVYVREDGLSERVVWGGGGMVYTVVGDAPLTDIASVVARLPHHEAHRGTMARLGHGLSRLGSWINPFG
jgi:sigma-E factor negative regulatory protein RseB